VAGKIMRVGFRLISVQDYHRMAEAGIFCPDERIELIEGQIIPMAAKGTAHTAAVTRIHRLFRNRLGDKVLLRLQDPIALNDYSEPEPDVALVRPDPLDYEDHHPTVADVFLVIEVADSSLKFDCEVKAITYAKSGISDYWVLDVTARKLHVFRLPSADGYQSETILLEEVAVAPIAFPDCEIRVEEMLRPKE
jgi:Uma2 family endonuclease